jgi:hypothetical protein
MRGNALHQSAPTGSTKASQLLFIIDTTERTGASWSVLHRACLAIQNECGVQQIAGHKALEFGVLFVRGRGAPAPLCTPTGFTTDPMQLRKWLRGALFDGGPGGPSLLEGLLAAARGDWWRGSRSISGGILYDWGVHLLEYGLQLIDSDITEVAGFSKTGYWAPKTKWKKDTNEDEAEAVVRFRNGAWLTLNITSLDSNAKPGFLEITGTEGSYVMDWSGYTIHKREGQNYSLEQGAHYPNAWEKFYGNIADHLTKGAKLVITPEWSRRPIHILDLAAQSAT